MVDTATRISAAAFKRFLGIFKVPGHSCSRACTGGEARNFFQVPEPIWGRAQNFSKSQGIYLGENLHMTARTSLDSMLRPSRSQSRIFLLIIHLFSYYYFFIFPVGLYSFIFPTYSSHISSYFHIFYAPPG